MTRGRWLLPLLALPSFACTSLTEPTPTYGVEKAAPAPPPSAAPTPAPTPTPAPAPAQPPSGEQVAASHVLIAYKGAMRADPSITRSKEEARQRAEQILKRARGREDFGKLADEASDDPSAKMNHGSLGKFTRERMVKPFADAAFSIKPGDLSAIVETPFGYHVIKRTE